LQARAAGLHLPQLQPATTRVFPRADSAGPADRRALITVLATIVAHVQQEVIQ
jgi:hypothetical protein